MFPNMKIIFCSPSLFRTVELRKGDTLILVALNFQSVNGCV